MPTELNYQRIHAAMSKAGEKLEAERLARIAVRDARVPVELVASGEVVPCAVCGAPGRRYMNTKACPLHTPAAIAGRPEPPTPTCSKPLSCYLPCCAKKLQPAPVELRTDLENRIDEWRDYARGEIKVLAGQPYAFGPGDLAALLPVKLLGENAREHLLSLLDEGVKAGAIVAVGAHQWKGARS